ncbi:hypothetical protein C8034_v007794 [Colletotrichum sidae]|uniref:Uncharacterized protein n=1 Tax=Colletotrichum sidae TaxID=1347389 RepID=A0A4R8T3E9_9PEZI|nr:hypothetical protein C8034_v007794 [Colletotrichum sidae]
MSRLSPFPSNMTFRTESRASVAASDTTYHTCAYQSFNDVELFAPGSPPTTTKPTAPVPGPFRSSPAATSAQQQQQRSKSRKEREPEPAEMRRQDSGYESLPRSSSSSSSSSQQRRTSTASSSQSSSSSSPQHQQRTPSRPRGRPTIRRAPKTSPYPRSGNNNNINNNTAAAALYHHQHHPSSRHAQQQAATFFHFPAHPTDLELSSRHPRPPPPPPLPQQQQQQQQQVELELDQRGLLSPSSRRSQSQADERTEVAAAPLPPQATHYWTSDRTRRLEYAAIDAASRGVKGWCRRNLVPDCFVPREKHVAFDDDTGSVRRYRLELDEETVEKCEFGAAARRRWFGWRRSKTA